MDAINRCKVDEWKTDIEQSVDFYNSWFLSFAPSTFRNARKSACHKVDEVFELTDNGSNLTKALLAMAPQMLPVLRQMTCPPIARDRLAGLSKLPASTVKSFEDTERKPYRSSCRMLSAAEKIVPVLLNLLDVDLLPWLAKGHKSSPTREQRARAALVIADRLCGAYSDPIIRNAQESRQLDAISKFLLAKGYVKAHPMSFAELNPGEFAFHLNINVVNGDGDSRVNIPVDVAIQPKDAKKGRLPIMIEAKSAGDFANVNKRRKEEAQKITQLRRTYGNRVSFVLFLCGYFDTGYLGYEAAEGIDWVWEHRISDMRKLGL